MLKVKFLTVSIQSLYCHKAILFEMKPGVEKQRRNLIDRRLLQIST